ncbi:YdeI/OmpD-associated family protein [Flavobacterium sp. XS1P32]|uniref:YdeI/OmpD-associated family protein n=1 Tax=Flavobacterium sp. XS1P32 TaxID=3401726 RepID=UPI003AAFB99A
MLQEEFNTDPNLAQAFEKFSPYKQYEFLEYIETAKLKETKLSQIEKIKPMIKESIGLNDKYRYN